MGRSGVESREKEAGMSMNPVLITQAVQAVQTPGISLFGAFSFLSPQNVCAIFQPLYAPVLSGGLAQNGRTHGTV